MTFIEVTTHIFKKKKSEAQWKVAELKTIYCKSHHSSLNISFDDHQPSLPLFTQSRLQYRNSLDNEIVLCIVF